MVLLITEGLISVAVITKRIRENNSAASSLRWRADMLLLRESVEKGFMLGMDVCKNKVVFIIRRGRCASLLWQARRVPIV